jgi:hypothetical protein
MVLKNQTTFLLPLKDCSSSSRPQAWLGDAIARQVLLGCGKASSEAWLILRFPSSAWEPVINVPSEHPKPLKYGVPKSSLIVAQASGLWEAGYGSAVSSQARGLCHYYYGLIKMANLQKVARFSEQNKMAFPASPPHPVNLHRNRPAGPWSPGTAPPDDGRSAA